MEIVAICCRTNTKHTNCGKIKYFLILKEVGLTFRQLIKLLIATEIGRFARPPVLLTVVA
jgi:hypothetical protein